MLRTTFLVKLCIYNRDQIDAGLGGSAVEFVLSAFPTPLLLHHYNYNLAETSLYHYCHSAYHYYQCSQGCYHLLLRSLHEYLNRRHLPYSFQQLIPPHLLQNYLIIITFLFRGRVACCTRFITTVVIITR